MHSVYLAPVKYSTLPEIFRYCDLKTGEAFFFSPTCRVFFFLGGGCFFTTSKKIKKKDEEQLGNYLSVSAAILPV